MIRRLLQLSTTLILLFAGTYAVSHGTAADDVAKAPPDLALREEAAFRAAAAAVGPSVVAIETIGGLDMLGETLVGTGPSSGLIVSDDGYIISSTFNFAHKPASIIVSMADGRRLPAKLTARDHVRKLVLLKVDGAGKLPVPSFAPQADAVVGVWSIALGRTFEADRPNVSVGVISAVNRIWGKALQTDAKISPVNYGGPLVDVRGRVMGVLVPLSPQHSEDESGVEWYDSGIGFAVPMQHIERVLPRLKAGEDLKAGLLGVRFRGPNIYADPPLLAYARANSPAYKAGLRKGDQIKAVEGKPVELQVQVMEAVQSRYAGDTLRLTIARGDRETFEAELKLVDHLDPYKRPFLGFLPERVKAPGASGVGVRYVFEKSPAAENGLKAGDRVTAVGARQVDTREQLLLAVAEAEPGKPIELELASGTDRRKLQLTAAAQPEVVPAKFADPSDAAKPEAATELEKPIALQIAEFGNKCELYVPGNYRDDAPHGMVLLLHPMGGLEKTRLESLVKSWLPICRRDGLLLVVPHAADKQGAWAPDDLTYLGKVIDRVAEDHAVDPRRIVAFGLEEGGTLALRAAARFPERIRAVAMVNGAISGSAPENEPADPVAFYVAAEKNLPNLPRLKTAVTSLREKFFPVTYRELAPSADDLNAAQLDELARWIEMLDRI